MDHSALLKGGSFGTQRGLQMVEGFVISETRHRLGQQLPRHTHERATINYVLAGAYAETFRGVTRAYGPATIVAKPAGELHANHFRDSDARCLLIELTAERTEQLQSFAGHLHAPLSRAAPALRPLALRIVRELRAPDNFSPLALEAQVLELLVTEARSRNEREAGGAPSWLTRVVDSIHAHRSAPSLSEMAAEAGVHPAHLIRTFRKHFRTTPAEYARELRLSRAIERLRTSRGPIGTIAIEAGFFDQSHFTRAVKRKTGLTPRELRNSN